MRAYVNDVTWYCCPYLAFTGELRNNRGSSVLPNNWFSLLCPAAGAYPIPFFLSCSVRPDEGAEGLLIVIGTRVGVL
jgi:hypothetical protein